MFVVTINQRDTTDSGDRVNELLSSLSSIAAIHAFQRSWADEAIGVVLDAEDAVSAALIAIRQRRWNVGIGVGPVHQPIPADITQAEGWGLIYAREAVERAQQENDRIPLSVVGLNEEAATDAEAVLKLIGHLVATRTSAEWRTLDLLTPNVRGQYKAAAQALGVSVQAVSQTVRRSFWTQEWQTRPAAARLLNWVSTGQQTL